MGVIASDTNNFNLFSFIRLSGDENNPETKKKSVMNKRARSVIEQLNNDGY